MRSSVPLTAWPHDIELVMNLDAVACLPQIFSLRRNSDGSQPLLKALRGNGTTGTLNVNTWKQKIIWSLGVTVTGAIHYLVILFFWKTSKCKTHQRFIHCTTCVNRWENVL